ncbi:MAG TPA: carboxypeptidase regulatory-like domain-containing protein [Candidatus Kapabacteria bacterium]|nr:carboxypeptidase regulatory-like domain-containing protein [Candidatus Kapabacteria bacterium]
MKYIRFSIVLGILGLLSASLITSSCRHTSPTGPTDTTIATDTSSCCHGRITLTVYDSATGHALDGGSASLYEDDQLVSTKPMNVNGTVWDGLCPGHYHFALSKDGYHSTEFALDSLGCNATREVHHTMVAETTNRGDSCCGGVVELTVTDSLTSHGISGAEVVIYYNGTELRSTITTDNGSARFDGLCMGSYRITINHDGYSQGVIEFNEECNATHGFTKSLLSTTTTSTCDTASLTIHVRDSLHQDTNISGAMVTIRIDGHSDNFASGTTTDGGYYYSDHNLPGHTTYIVTISKDGYNTNSFAVQIGDCKNYEELIYLSPQ